MRVFLTGGTGFVGQRVVQVLRRRGWEVVALVRDPDSTASETIRALGAVLAHGDILDPDSMRGGMQGADAVIHNAAWYRFGIRRKERARMEAINVQGTVNTLQLAVDLDVRRIVHVSTILTFGDTRGVTADERFDRTAPCMSCYERTKTEAHEFAVKLQDNGAPIVIACPAGVVGPGDHSGLGHLSRMYVRGFLPPVLFAPNGCRAHVHVSDAAEAIARCVESGHIGDTYVLSGGVLPHRDMFRVWKGTPGGLKATVFWMPYPFAMLFNCFCGPIERLLRLPLLFCREFGRAAFATWSFSAAKAERELGMSFRSAEQAWLDTLQAERSIAMSERTSKSPGTTTGLGRPA